MIGRAATSAARRVCSMLDPRRVCSMLAPAHKSRPSDCSILRKASSCNRDPSLWTIHAPIPPGQYCIERTEYEGSRLQASSSHHKTKTNIFVARLVGGRFSAGSRYVLTPLSFGDDGRLCAPKYSIRFPFHYSHMDRVDCNGVICHPIGDYLVVWNPTTMEMRKLPNSPNTGRATGSLRMENTYIACWADSDSEEDDYKVIRFFYYVDDYVDDGVFEIPVEIELYSLKTDSWQNITCGQKLTAPIYPCYADGAVYWSHYDYGRRCVVLMSFDFRSEIFSTSSLPPLGEMAFCGPVQFNGQLSVVTSNLNPSRQQCLWVMRNGEWDRLCGYHFSKDLNRPLGFARNGEVVLFERFFGEPKWHYVLMAFDSITGELKQVPGFASRTCLEVFEFAEIFVKLKPSSSSLQ